jgi:hypothetical protein
MLEKTCQLEILGSCRRVFTVFLFGDVKRLRYLAADVSGKHTGLIFK